MAALAAAGRLNSVRPGYLWDLLATLVIRDITLRYKGSVLGIGWSLLNPLAQVVVFTFLSRTILNMNIADYPAFVFIGTVAWSWFLSSLMAAASCFVDNRDLIKRPGFPVPILVPVVIVSQMFHFAVAGGLLIVALLITSRGSFENLLMLPIAMIVQFIFTIGLAYYLACWQVFYRDTINILGVVLMVIFYVTPIFYDYKMAPEQYHFIFGLNPLTHMLDVYRSALLGGSRPSLLPLALTLVGGALLLVGGGLALQRARRRFAEEL